jgi:HEAT repeat protein
LNSVLTLNEKVGLLEVADLLEDRDVAMRLLALELLWSKGALEVENLSTALADDDKRVRLMAVRVTRRVPQELSQRLLLEALATEGDGEVFRILHDALTWVSKREVFLPVGGEEDAESRAKTIASWRRELTS